MAALSTGNLSTRKKQVFYFRWKLPRNSSFWLWNGQCMFFWKLDSCYKTNSPPALGHGFAFDHRLLVPFAVLEDNKGWFCQNFCQCKEICCNMALPLADTLHLILWDLSTCLRVSCVRICSNSFQSRLRCLGYCLAHVLWMTAVFFACGWLMLVLMLMVMVMVMLMWMLMLIIIIIIINNNNNNCIPFWLGRFSYSNTLGLFITTNTNPSPHGNRF